MDALDELVEKLSGLSQIPDLLFKSRIFVQEIVQFYMTELNVGQYEVAIFLANKQNTILSFIYPDYLVSTGSIPINSMDAIASSIYRSSRCVIENHLQQQKHLAVFQSIRVPGDGIQPLWKMIGVPISLEGKQIGVLEISRRSEKQQDAGADFHDGDMALVKKSISKLSQFLKDVIPQDCEA